MGRSVAYEIQLQCRIVGEALLASCMPRRASIECTHAGLPPAQHSHLMPQSLAVAMRAPSPGSACATLSLVTGERAARSSLRGGRQAGRSVGAHWHEEMACSMLV